MGMKLSAGIVKKVMNALWHIFFFVHGAYNFSLKNYCFFYKVIPLIRRCSTGVESQKLIIYMVLYLWSLRAPWFCNAAA
jgi:hypothetical protein